MSRDRTQAAARAQDRDRVVAHRLSCCSFGPGNQMGLREGWTEFTAVVWLEVDSRDVVVRNRL